MWHRGGGGGGAAAAALSVGSQRPAFVRWVNKWQQDFKFECNQNGRQILFQFQMFYDPFPKKDLARLLLLVLFEMLSKFCGFVLANMKSFIVSVLSLSSAQAKNFYKKLPSQAQHVLKAPLYCIAL